VENSPNHHKIKLSALTEHLRGEKKLYILLAALFAVILLIGFISPSLLHQKRDTWNTTLETRLQNINTSTVSIFNEKQQQLHVVLDNLSNELQASASPQKSLEILKEEKYSSYQIFLLDSVNHEVGTNAVIGADAGEIIAGNAQTEGSYFYTNPLITLICKFKNVRVAGEHFRLLAAKVIETDYQTSGINPDENISDVLENQFDLEVTIAYSPSKAKTLDGRYYSFDIPNENGKKIGLVTIAKPTLKAELKSFREATNEIQSLFIIIGFILLGFVLRNETKAVSLIFLRPILAICYLIIFRGLIFTLGFPAMIFKGDLTNPNYFSSAFAWGIVKSPLEFLTTAVFFSVIVFILYTSILPYFENVFAAKKRMVWKRLFFGIVSLFVILLSIRGISAAVKSVVFDSSLRYFETADIIPGVPHLVMHIATFIVVLSGFVLMQLLLKITLECFSFASRRVTVLVHAIIFTIAAVLLYFIQKQPLVSLWFYLFAVLLLLTVFTLTQGTRTTVLKKILFLAFASSLLTISLMNFFNSELEKEEIKRTALLLSRHQESYMNFLLNESLTKAAEQTKLLDNFSVRGVNENALALDLWLNSSLRHEKVSSSITLLDKRKQVIGYFSNGVDEELQLPQIVRASITNGLQIFDVSDKSKQWQRIFTGIIPIIQRNEIVGYITETLLSTTRNALSVNPVAALFQSPQINFRSLSEKNFIVFLLADDLIYPINGSTFPSASDADKIYSFLSKEKEGWITYNSGADNLLGFGIQRLNAGSHPFLIAAQKETAFSFSLFNFFKLFIIHITFLIAVLAVLFVILTKGKFNLTFRTQLLSAFLVIAILPIIALAVYNRNSVEDKNISLVYTTLKEKENLAENYFKLSLRANPKLDLQKMYRDAGKNLLLSFSIFKDSKIDFSTQQNLFSAELLRAELPKEVENNISKTGNGYFLQRPMGSHTTISFFKPLVINNQEVVIEVNDYFNQIPVALSFVEVNVFLFGVYSLAIVLIIVISSLLADQISLPIRRLTRATRAVAHGDLNVTLDDTSMGEMKELISGFNIMTDELRKNQKELAELEREQAWKDMARQVAHEIKNPLTPMKLTLQQLTAMYREKSKNFDSLFEKVSETILAQIATLSQIASEFSNFAKMPPLNLASVNLKQILNEIIILFNDENISLKLNYQTEEERVEADLSQVNRMFINLIRNAMQAGARNVELLVTQEQSDLCIRVIDDGKGIPQPLIHKVFTANFTTKSGGMGLGLKLAKKFMESIKGEISVESSSGNGTTFLIKFSKKIIVDHE